MTVPTCSANSVTPLGVLMSTSQILVLVRCHCMVKDRSRHVRHTQTWFIFIIPGYTKKSQLNNSHIVFQWHTVEPKNPQDFWSAKTEQEYKIKIVNPTGLGHSSPAKLYEHYFYCKERLWSMSLMHCSLSIIDPVAALSFQSTILNLCYCCFRKSALTDTSSMLMETIPVPCIIFFFLLFLKYKTALQTNQFHLGHKYACYGRYEFPKGVVNNLSFQNKKTYIKILQITTTKSWNYNLIYPGKLQSWHLGIEGQKHPVFAFHQLRRVSFPQLSSLLSSPELFFSVCPIWPSELDCLQSSLAAC